MGGPMAANLAAAGHEVIGYDVLPEALAAATTVGVVGADSAVEAAADAEVVLTMLNRGDVVRSVLLGSDGVLAHLRSGTIVIDSSSIDVATTRELHKQSSSRSVGYLDAPVSGGVSGGDAETLQRVRPVLDVMGAKVVHAGPPGSGQAVKALNQMLFGSTLVAVAEAFTLADRLGLDPTVLYDVVTSASGDCWAIRNFCPWPGVVPGSAADAGYEPRFAARLISKDLNLATSAAADVGQHLPVAAVTAALYEQLANLHQDDVDSSAVIEVLPGSSRPGPHLSTAAAEGA